MSEPNSGLQPGGIVDQVDAARSAAIGVLSAALPDAARVLVQGLDPHAYSADRQLESALAIFDQWWMLANDRGLDEPETKGDAGKESEGERFVAACASLAARADAVCRLVYGSAWGICPDGFGDIAAWIRIGTSNDDRLGAVLPRNLPVALGVFLQLIQDAEKRVEKLTTG